MTPFWRVFSEPDIAHHGVRWPATTPATNQALALPTPLAFVSNLDLECFKTDPFQPPASAPIVLSHLNPVLANLPRESVTLGPRTQLCAPVAKNGRIPPPGVLDFVRFIDLKCYVIQPQASLNIGLNLDIGPRNVAERQVELGHLEKFDIIAPPLPATISLRLQHINPLLANLPAEPARLTGAAQLGLPVAKNGVIPPG